MRAHTTHYACDCYVWNEDLESIPKGELFLIRAHYKEEDREVVFVGGLLPYFFGSGEYVWSHAGDGRMGTMLSAQLEPRAWMYIPGVDYGTHQDEG